MPSQEQQRDVRRFVDNKALALQNANHEAGNKFIGYVEMANLLPEWKYGFDWLRASPSQALQHAPKHLDEAFSNCLDKRAEYPRFKNADKGTASASRKDSNSIRKTVAFSFRNWVGSATATAGMFLALFESIIWCQGSKPLRDNILRRADHPAPSP
jgi:transposase